MGGHVMFDDDQETPNVLNVRLRIHLAQRLRGA